MARPVVYSNLKVLAFADRLGRETGPLEPPVHVRIKPTNACNESCWYCAYRYDELQLGGGMDLRDRIPYEKMLEIADDLVAMGVRAVTFSGGGEPLTYRRLPEIVRHLAEGGIAVGSLTNGVALSGEMADAFAEHGTWIRVSLDGWDASSYAHSRSVQPRIFERVCENISAFARRQTRCTIGVSFIITRENAEHVFDACRLVKSLGVRHVKLSPCVVADRSEGNNAYHAPIAAGVREQIAAALALQSEDFEVLDHYHDLPTLFERPYDRCPMLQMLTVIGADLGVYTCQDKAYTQGGLLGSIKDRRFRDFWGAPETAVRVRGFDPREACRHHCVAHAKNVILTELRSLDPAHAVFV